MMQEELVEEVFSSVWVPPNDGELLDRSKLVVFSYFILKQQ